MVGVSGSLIVSPNAFLQLHLRRSVVIIMSTGSDMHVHEGRKMKLTADNLIRGIDRRIHAKTPDIFEILSTVQKVGLSMVYK